MVSVTDALIEAPERVNYHTGMLLDEQDFRDEQIYHRGRLARALAWLHGPGTVGGLQVVAEETAGREELKIEPGLAIDYAGRLIELRETHCLDLTAWFAGLAESDSHALNRATYGKPYDGVVTDVFIAFSECPRGKMPAFATGPFDALDAVQDSRIRDAFRLEFHIRDRTVDATPPVPVERWSAVNPGAPLTELKAAILDSNTWKPIAEFRRDQNGNAQPVPQPEHMSGQDPTSLLIARVTVPASQGETTADAPLRNVERAVSVDNTIRQFVYSPGALLKLA